MIERDPEVPLWLDVVVSLLAIFALFGAAAGIWGTVFILRCAWRVVEGLL